MTKNIRDYLPDQKPTALVQTKCDAELVEMTRKQMAADSITWRDLLEASFKKYLQESRSHQAKQPHSD